MRKRDPAAVHFAVTDRERAAFEAGIKLGTLFHQYVGVPVSPATAVSLERAIERATRAQPFVASAKVRIDRGRLRRSLSRFGYASLEGHMLRVELLVRYRSAAVKATLRYEPSLRYPLMAFEHAD